MILRWLFSRTLREACALRKHVQRLLNAQRDVLTPAALQIVNGAIVGLQTAISTGAKKQDLRKQMGILEQVAVKWIKPHPHPAWRENVEVLLVALAVAMGIRTFFLQPFKIPTGSMQPTLFGVTSMNLIGDTQFRMPTGWERVKEWFEGVSYVHVVAPADGRVDGISPMHRFLIFNITQSISIGGVHQTIWFPPDFGEAPPGADPLVYRAGLYDGTGRVTDRVFHKGDDVIKLKVQSGDHLFVDRLTYNFRKPERGETVVFETRGISEEMRGLYNIPADEFYIKRLVGLGGETISLKQDYLVTGVPMFGGQPVPVGRLVVNGQPLSASTPRFENLYSVFRRAEGRQDTSISAKSLFRPRDDSEIGSGLDVSDSPEFLFCDGRQHDEQSRLAILGRFSIVQRHWQIVLRVLAADQAVWSRAIRQRGMSAANPETVLITGASSGIGLELAKCFAADGCRLILVARSQDALEKLAGDLRRENHVEVVVLPGDLSQSETPLRIFNELTGRKIFSGRSGQQRRLRRHRAIRRAAFGAAARNAPGQHHRAHGTDRIVSARNDRAAARRNPQRRIRRRFCARTRHGDLLRNQGFRPFVHRGAGRRTRRHRS